MSTAHANRKSLAIGLGKVQVVGDETVHKGRGLLSEPISTAWQGSLNTPPSPPCSCSILLSMCAKSQVCELLPVVQTDKARANKSQNCSGISALTKSKSNVTKSSSRKPLTHALRDDANVTEDVKYELEFCECRRGPPTIACVIRPYPNSEEAGHFHGQQSGANEQEAKSFSSCSRKRLGKDLNDAVLNLFEQPKNQKGSADLPDECGTTNSKLSSGELDPI
eukprot:756153-Hanusia_phi.AAC.4